MSSIERIAKTVPSFRDTILALFISTILMGVGQHCVDGSIDNHVHTVATGVVAFVIAAFLGIAGVAYLTKTIVSIIRE